MSTKTAQAGYHHGDLKATLLEHGIELARHGGPDAVSLRAVQRRAGVSNAAAYRHYSDRLALLAAIADFAAARLADEMSAAIAAVPVTKPAATARARLRATGLAYIHFALAEPGLFAVAFLDEPPIEMTDLAQPPPTAQGAAGLGPYELLGQGLDEMVAAKALKPANRPLTDIACWSAVHGISVLMLSSPLKGLPASERDAAIERLLDIVQAGIT